MVNYYLILAFGLFFIGMLGFLLRKNAFVVFMSVELMLNAAALIFAAFSRMSGNLDGFVSVLLIIAIAAAEASFGLALIVLMHKKTRSINIENFNELKDENAR